MPYIGKAPSVQNIIKLDNLTASATASYTMQRDGANFSPQNINTMLVSLNGIIQSPGTSFTISGSTITFASTLSSSDSIDFILIYGDVLDTGVPSDSSVTNAKLNTAPTLISKGGGGEGGAIQLNCEVNSHGVKLKSPDHSAGQSWTLKLPDNSPTADKFLKVKSITGSGSTAVGHMEFASAGGGLVLLNRQVVSSSTAFVEFNNTYINSTYDDYIIKASRIVPTTDSVAVRIFTSDQNGGNQTQGWYSNAIYQRLDNGSIAHSGYLSNQTYWHIQGGGYIGTASGESTTYTVHLNNVNNSLQGGTTARTEWSSHNANNYYYHGIHSAYLDNGAVTNYIRLYFASGNIASGTFTLYGLAKS